MKNVMGGDRVFVYNPVIKKGYIVSDDGVFEIELDEKEKKTKELPDNIDLHGEISVSEKTIKAQNVYSMVNFSRETDIKLYKRNTNEIRAVSLKHGYVIAYISPSSNIRDNIDENELEGFINMEEQILRENGFIRVKDVELIDWR